MAAMKLVDDVYWVGAIDFNLRNFHGYATPRGSSYNAYLVKGQKKTALIDTVKYAFTDELVERIKSVMDPKDIDLIVCNHVEMDHSSAIPELLTLNPNLEIYASKKGEAGLKDHYGDQMSMKVVAEGDTLDLGGKTLQFFPVPLVHWPDSMMTYLAEDKILFPNDAFGQHFAFSKLWDDENDKGIILSEAKTYYANIVMPYGKQVQKALKSLESLKVDMIAPSHGVLWRKHIDEIVQNYGSWSAGQIKKQAVIVYDSMWGSTEKMATWIRLQLDAKGIPSVQRNLTVCENSDVITDLLESEFVFVGTPNLNTQMLPNVASFLTYVKGLKPQNKKAMVFGSYGWGTQSVKQVLQDLESMGWDVDAEPLTQKYLPTEDTHKEIAARIEQFLN
jgi:flavorubredoxin